MLWRHGYRGFRLQRTLRRPSERKRHPVIRLATTREEATAMAGSEQQWTPDSGDQCVRCSFCNKGTDEVGELIEGPAWRGRIPACICADCVELCAAMLEQRRLLRDAGQDPDASQKMLAEKIPVRPDQPPKPGHPALLRPVRCIPPHARRSHSATRDQSGASAGNRDRSDRVPPALNAARWAALMR
jgi:hypothetical protein